MEFQPKKFLLGKIKYLPGDASMPHSSDNRLILSFNDTNGDWETENFNTRLSKRWEKAKTEFRMWHRSFEKLKLGSVNYLTVQSDTKIAYLVCKENEALNINALELSLKEVSKNATLDKNNIHLEKPNYDNWENIEKLLFKYFVENNLNVFVYEKIENNVK